MGGWVAGWLGGWVAGWAGLGWVVLGKTDSVFKCKVLNIVSKSCDFKMEVLKLTEKGCETGMVSDGRC